MPTFILRTLLKVTSNGGIVLTRSTVMSQASLVGLETKAKIYALVVSADTKPKASTLELVEHPPI